MQTRYSSRLASDQSSNPTSSTNPNPKGQNHRRSKQWTENSNLEEQSHLIVTMTNNRTMVEFLRAPTEGGSPPVAKKEPPRSITMWEDLAWDRYKDLFRACTHHGFAELHQLNTFYNALNPSDQDSLNVAGGNLLERRTQDVFMIIENKSKIATFTHAVNQQMNVVTTAMTAILKQYQANPPPAPVKAVEETCVTCRGSGSLPSNTVANPKGELKAITTCSGLVINGPTVPTPSQSINPKEDERVEETFTDPNLAEYTIKKMLKALLSNQEKLQELANTPLNENCSAVILKKLPKKLRDPEKFLIPCGFSELKCKALADLGASINLMPLYVWKKLGLPELILTRMTIKLANRAICTPDGIARDVFIPVGKFTFPTYFVIVDYESDPRVPFILGRPFLWTAHALIDVHSEEMILRDSDERLTLNMRHDTSSYSNQPQKESINLINVFNNSNSSLKDSIDQKNHAYLADIFVDSLPEMFTDEHTLDYSSPPIFDVYADDFLEVESNAENIYNDPFDSKGKKIKDSKLLIDELDLPCDFHPPSEYDSFISQDFFRVDALPSINTEDKIFNPCILIQEKPVEIITRVVQDKKLVISNASLIFEDFDPPFYEPLFFKEVPKSKMLLLFLSENEEKVFKPGIHTSEKLHSYFIPELCHQGYIVFKINQIFKSLMKIFLFYCRNDTHILAIPHHHFYPS
nr:reverse transcriptase domain-containing protein [Tanacetum cinerariifolium]